MRHRLPSLLLMSMLLAGCASPPPAAAPPVRGQLVEGDSAPLLETAVPPFEAEDAPLARVLDDLSRQSGVMIVANYPAMELAGVGRETPVRLTAPRALPLGQVLDLILGQAGGGFVELVARERDGVVTITTREASVIEDRRVGVYAAVDLLSDMRRAAAAFPDARFEAAGSATRPGFAAEDFRPIIPGAAERSPAPDGPAEARLLALLSDLFADPAADGPPRITARLETGVLIVEATPADHARVGQFLTLLRDTLRSQLKGAAGN